MGDVTLAYLHPDVVSANFHKSLVDLVVWDFGHAQRLDSYQAMRCASGGLVKGRNTVAASFLDDTDTEWLFWLDSDMGFAPNTLDALLAVAEGADLPIVGGLCFAWKEVELDQLGGFRCVPRPTIFDYVTTDDGVRRFAGRTTYEAGTLTRCAGTGSACILIRRDVMSAIRAEYGDTWYTRLPGSDGEPLGEDISFCVRAQALDFPIHVHTGIHTNHHKSVWVSELDYRAHYPDSVKVPERADA